MLAVAEETERVAVVSGHYFILLLEFLYTPNVQLAQILVTYLAFGLLSATPALRCEHNMSVGKPVAQFVGIRSH